MGREQKSFNGFKFGTLIGRFPSDSAASMAVKGLNKLNQSIKPHSNSLNCDGHMRQFTMAAVQPRNAELPS